MTELIGRVCGFETTVFPRHGALYGRLARDGQSPGALIVSCADSRIVPEQIMQAGPGELFVCRNAGNIVPPHAEGADGVAATVEYAVRVLGIRDVVVCGHSDCGAMKGLAGDPAALATLPEVTGWLRHAAVARAVVDAACGDLDADERVHAISLENIVAQLSHLRTYPSVAAGIAKGEIALHGWFVDIHAGRILALDGATGRFVPVGDDAELPVAHVAAPRVAAASITEFAYAQAAE